jgi:purine-cytosine permease-like protein
MDWIIGIGAVIVVVWWIVGIRFMRKHKGKL